MPNRSIASLCALVFALPVFAQPQAVIRVPQDAPTIQAALDSTGGDPRIELAAGLYRELVVVEGVSPTFAPQAGAEGQVSWSADLDEDGVADGLAIDIRGVQTVQLAATIEGIEFLGAGIEAAFTELVVDGCSFTGNTADEPRALTLWDCHVVVDGCAFTDAVSSQGGGGAILSSSTTFVFPEVNQLDVRNSTFERCRTFDNVNSGGGGAIWARFVSIEQSIFRECRSDRDGGAVYAHQFGTVVDCEFVGNTTTGPGGAVAFQSVGGPSTIRRSVFRSNRAAGGTFSQGGAVYGSMTLSGCIFENNSAEDAGGAVVLSNLPGNLDGPAITASAFTGNYVFGTNGAGGAVCVEDSIARVTDSVFIRNQAPLGGAIVAGRAPIDVTGCLFAANQADTGSAAASVRSFQGCVFMANAGVVLSPGRYGSTTSHSVFLDNTGPAYEWNTNPDQPFTPPLPASSVFGPGQAILIDGDRPTTPLTACIGDPLLIGVSAINLDPMFTRWPSDGGDGWGDDPLTPGVDESANDDFGDLTPLPGSPMIDAAPMLDDTPALDMAGNPRVHDDPGIPTARPDIGPYEFQGESCLPDVNRDGLPTPADMNAWIDAFNIRAPLADQNRDGALTPADYHGWILNFNAGCP